MRKTFLALLLGLIGSTLWAQAAPEVDSAEAVRRGDMVVVAGEGPRGAAEEAFLLAMAPPVDDSHKWFVTVFWMDNCPPCAKLKADFRKAPELTAFVAATDMDKAWAHYQEFNVHDESQKERLKHYRLDGAKPIIVIQPPRNGMWGPASTVVFQQSGYDGKPEKLSATIIATVKKFSAKMVEKGYPKEPSRQSGLSAGQGSSLTASLGGARQVVEEAVAPVGTNPPFQPPVQPDPFQPQPQYQPQQPSQWPPPAVQPAPVVVTPAEPPSVPTKESWFSPTSLLLILLVGLRLLERIAPLTPNKIDDLVARVLRQLLPQGPNQPPTPPAASR